MENRPLNVVNGRLQINPSRGQEDRIQDLEAVKAVLEQRLQEEREKALLWEREKQDLRSGFEATIRQREEQIARLEYEGRKQQSALQQAAEQQTQLQQRLLEQGRSFAENKSQLEARIVSLNQSSEQVLHGLQIMEKRFRDAQADLDRAGIKWAEERQARAEDKARLEMALATLRRELEQREKAFASLQEKDGTTIEEKNRRQRALEAEQHRLEASIRKLNEELGRLQQKGLQARSLDEKSAEQAAGAAPRESDQRQSVMLTAELEKTRQQLAAADAARRQTEEERGVAAQALAEIRRKADHREQTNAAEIARLKRQLEESATQRRKELNQAVPANRENERRSPAATKSAEEDHPQPESPAPSEPPPTFPMAWVLAVLILVSGGIISLMFKLDRYNPSSIHSMKVTLMLTITLAGLLILIGHFWRNRGKV